MKSVMISIRPKWCELIASGRKTIEVRKTRPKSETPFKCYIYCTKGQLAMLRDSKDTEDPYKYDKWEYAGFHESCGKTILGGKVIGEFVCDEILQFNRDDYNSPAYDISDDDLNRTCLLQEDLYRYASGKTLYGWHISDLVIYDKPKELSEFKKINRKCFYADLGLAKRDCEECQNTDCAMTRPPQSWCYCEGAA